MYRLLHISISPVMGAFADHKILESRLTDLGRDWLRYNTFCWMLWTNKSSITISEMISMHLDPQDQLLVIGVSPLDLPTGRLPQWAWEWINRPRNVQTGDILTPALPAPAAKNVFDPALLLARSQTDAP